MKKCVLKSCAVVLAIALTAFSTSTNLTVDAYQYNGPWYDPDFEMGENATPLNYAANWSSSNPVCASGSNEFFLCKARVAYSITAPSKQQVIDAVRTEYEELAMVSQTFTDFYSFQVVLNGETVSIEIRLKHVD